MRSKDGGRDPTKVRDLYEEFPFPLKGNLSGFLRRYVFPYAPVRAAKVLDAGCGTGNMTVELAREFPSARIVGVDFSEKSLTAARLLAERRRLSNVSFRHQDLMDAFPSSEMSENYDFAISIGCVHHIPDPAAVLRNIRTVLAKDAVLVIGVYGKYGRIETEIRRRLVDLLREVTGGTTRDLISLCHSVLMEPALRENSFYKTNVLLMPLKSPRRFASLAARALLRRAGVGRRSERIPVDISRADQYLHPLVLGWTAGQWLDTIESAGFEVERFIYDPAPAGMCVPRDAVARIRGGQLRALLETMPPRTRYEALDLIFRPSMHIMACKPAA